MPFEDRSPLNYRINTQSPIPRRMETRAPLDNQDGFSYQLFTQWLDTSSDDLYVLVSRTRTTTLWIRIGGTGGPVESFLPDSGTSPVVPDGANQITITGSNGLSFVGGLNTLTVQSDNGQIVTKIIPDAGTSPVVPDSAGEITVTGAQVATGTIGANVIRTDSLAANTYTIEIQQTASAAAQDTTLNGVSHFDSDAFTVSSGFVSLKGGGAALTQINVDNGVSPVIPDPSDGSIDMPDGNGIALTGSGTPNNIATIDMNSPFTGDFTFQSVTSADTEILTVENTSNTASSAAQILTQVAGATAADPMISWSVSGVTQYDQYLDNSDSDSFKLDLNGTGTYQKFFSTGERILPLQPVFFARLSATATNQTGAGANPTIIFDTEATDIGGNYDNTTGVFTAPVDGNYLFYAAVLCGGLTAAMTQVILFMSGSQGGWINIGAVRDSSNQHEVQSTIIRSLSATNTVSVACQIAGGAGDTASFLGNATVNYTYFCGFLIS